jgi:DNA-3-methyladenine glycosylase II
LRRIETEADIDAGLDALCRADRRLRPVRERAGRVPLRRMAPGFASLASIIIAQQVSRASADAILARLNGLMEPLTPAGILDAADDLFRQAGVSRPKQRTLVAAAHAIAEGRLDLDHAFAMDAEQAAAAMTAVPGIGPWTAECYLLFASGHPDIFPAGDIALQAAVAHAFELAERPKGGELTVIAEPWAPWRGVAARLFWAYYGATGKRDAAPAS